jgi:hypothetical protein
MLNDTTETPIVTFTRILGDKSRWSFLGKNFDYLMLYVVSLAYYSRDMPGYYYTIPILARRIMRPTIGIEPKTLGKAIRPPKHENFVLPDRKAFETTNHVSLEQHAKEIPSLADPASVKKVSVIDEIMLSLAWNNPALADIPVLGASTVDQPCEKHESAREVAIEQNAATSSVDNFLMPPSLEAMVSPSLDEHLRNARSLYKMAISQSLRKSISLNPGN